MRYFVFLNGWNVEDECFDAYEYVDANTEDEAVQLAAKKAGIVEIGDVNEVSLVQPDGLLDYFSA